MSPGDDDVVRRLTGLHIGRVGSGGVVELADGRRVFVKHSEDPGSIAAEVAGLRWLTTPGAPRVPEVLGHDESWLVLEYLPPATPTPEVAVELGRSLARLHAAGAQAFGEPPRGGPVNAWIGRAPMRNVTGSDWPSWYVEHRVHPYLRTARDRGDLDRDQAGTIERACAVVPDAAGPPVPPARLHGDLWSGNVCWSGSPAHGWLIDPAAHGGHPETDLAMLALFGCPHLDRVLTGYQQVSLLPAGWHRRVAMHQLFPLLVHVVLFGRGYAEQAAAAARSTSAAAQRLP